jgi:hypothetical protein
LEYLHKESVTLKQGAPHSVTFPKSAAFCLTFSVSQQSLHFVPADKGETLAWGPAEDHVASFQTGSVTIQKNMYISMARKRGKIMDNRASIARPFQISVVACDRLGITIHRHCHAIPGHEKTKRKTSSTAKQIYRDRPLFCAASAIPKRKSALTARLGY